MTLRRSTTLLLLLVVACVSAPEAFAGSTPTQPPNASGVEQYVETMPSSGAKHDPANASGVSQYVERTPSSSGEGGGTPWWPIALGGVLVAATLGAVGARFRLQSRRRAPR